jgi:tRNA threonylcarbamoyladenosine biosynthesis protein TsaB
MLTLAIDTSTRIGSVALADHDGLVAESLLPVRATHSETVLPEIERLLSSGSAGPSDLEAVVVGSGPGSFTGVRIAASLAKGISFALDARLYAYSSLAAIAAGTGIAGSVCAVLDARRGQLYAAGYDLAAGFRELFAPRAASLADLLEQIGPVGDWCFAGLLPAELEEGIEASGGRVLPRHLGVPRASSLLWLAGITPDTGAIPDRRAWEPEYVRLPAAQRVIPS